MKVLVTGAAGFVGRNLVEKLSTLNLDIMAIDALDSTLYSSKIKRFNLDAVSKLPGVTCFVADLAINDIPDEVLNCDVVVNLAALPGQLLSWEFGPEYNKSNYLTVSKLLAQYARIGKFPKWIQASTSSVYGKEATQGESGECNPCNPYGVTKLAAEKQLHAYSQYFDFKYVILRYFSLFGPFQRPDMAISKFFKSIDRGEPITIYGDGLQTRDLTFISDAIDATYLAMTNQTGQNEIFNVSGGGIYTALEIAEACFEISQKQTSLQFVKRPIGDQLNTLGNSKKSRELLGFSPRVNLYQGLEFQWQNYLYLKTASG